MVPCPYFKKILLLLEEYPLITNKFEKIATQKESIHVLNFTKKPIYITGSALREQLNRLAEKQPNLKVKDLSIAVLKKQFSLTNLKIGELPENVQQVLLPTEKELTQLKKLTSPNQTIADLLSVGNTAKQTAHLLLQFVQHKDHEPHFFFIGNTLTLRLVHDNIVNINYEKNTHHESERTLMRIAFADQYKHFYIDLRKSEPEIMKTLTKILSRKLYATANMRRFD